MLYLCDWKDKSYRNEISAKANQCEGPLIGYRRHDVVFLKIRPWSIRLPGSFADNDRSAALIFNQPDDAQMQSVNYAGKHALICTYVCPPEELQWAIDTWHSIKFSENKPTWQQERFGGQ